MKIKYSAMLLIMGGLIFQSCSSVKVVNSWKGTQEDINSFKEKNILVIARTADHNSRVEFEEAIANQMRAKGFTVKESFWRLAKLHPEREMTEERKALIKKVLEIEKYTGIVVTTIKDKQETTTISSNGIYIGATYGNSYPGYYGNFYNYYSDPYANGYYYGGFRGYIPVSTSTQTRTNYVLETVAFNLDSSQENQLVAVITSEIKNPKDAHKTAEEFIKKVVKSLK